MPPPSWNDDYASGRPLPWDTGTPDPMLVEMIESHAIEPGRTLEVGCGTGTNAIYLAQHGFEVVGVDISPLAVESARAKANVLPVKVRFVERLGSVTIAYGTSARTDTEVTVQLPGDFDAHPGETIRPGVAPHACYLFDANGRAFPRLIESSQDTPEVALPRGLG